MDCVICGNNSHRDLIDIDFFKRLCNIFGRDSISTLIIKGHKNLKYIYCLGCGLISQRFPPSDESLSEFYRVWRSGMDLGEFREYTQMKSRLNSKRIEWMEQDNALRLTKGTMLDIGTADGSMCFLFQKKGWEAIGVEQTEELVKFSKGFYGNIKILHSRYKKALFPEKYFDLIVYSHCLEHFRDPSEALEICSYHLKDNGYLFIEVPTFISNNFSEFGSTHFFIFTEYSLSMLLSMRNLRINRLDVFFDKASQRRNIRLLCQKGVINKNLFITAKKDLRKEYKYFRFLILTRYIYIFAVRPFINFIKKIIKKDERLVIIESLNAISLFYILFARIFSRLNIFCLRYKGPVNEKIYDYFNIRLIDIDSIDLAGLNIPAYLLDEFPELRRRINETSLIMTERYSKQIFEENLKLLKRLGYFLGDCDISIALKRYILFDISKKVKNYELSLIILRYENAKNAIYLPDDFQLDFLRNDELYKSLSLSTPCIIGSIISIISYFKYRLISGLGSILLIFNILKRGMAIKNPLVNKNMAMPVIRGVKANGELLEKIFMDDNKLSASGVLFTKECWPVDDKTLRFFSAHKIDMVDPYKIKPSYRYFLNRIVIGYYFSFFLPAFFLSVFKKSQFFLLYLVRACKNLIDYEIFLERYNFKVYLARDEYSINSNIRTVVFNKKGIKVIGMPHGDYNHPLIQPAGVFSYIQLDEYLLWGMGYEQYFQPANKDILKYTAAGLPMLNFIKDAVKEQDGFADFLKDKKRKYKILSIFTGYINEKFLRARPHRLMENINYFKYILNIYKDYKDKYNLFLVFKYKDSCPYEDIAVELKDLLNTFDEESPGIASFSIDKNTYVLTAYSDVVVAWGSTSIGAEAISTYKPVVYYDPYKCRDNIFRSLFGAKIVAWNEDELRESVFEILSGKRDAKDKIYEYIRSKFCNIDGATKQTDPAKLIRESIYAYL